jgi:predicted  nucleic acid-binding Zn-ribbon protein
MEYTLLWLLEQWTLLEIEKNLWWILSFLTFLAPSLIILLIFLVTGCKFRRDCESDENCQTRILIDYVKSDIKVLNGSVKSIEVLEKHVAQLHNEMSSVQDIVKVDCMGRAKSENEIASIKYMINELQSDMHSKTNMGNQFQNAVASIGNMMKQFENEVTSVTNMTNQFHNKADAMKIMMYQFQNEVDSIKNMITLLESEMKSIRNGTSEFQNEIVSVKYMMEEDGKRLAEIQTEVDVLNRNVQICSGSLARFQEEMDSERRIIQVDNERHSHLHYGNNSDTYKAAAGNNGSVDFQDEMCPMTYRVTELNESRPEFQNDTDSWGDSIEEYYERCARVQKDMCSVENITMPRGIRRNVADTMQMMVGYEHRVKVQTEIDSMKAMPVEQDSVPQPQNDVASANGNMKVKYRIATDSQTVMESTNIMELEDQHHDRSHSDVNSVLSRQTADNRHVASVNWFYRKDDMPLRKGGAVSRGHNTQRSHESRMKMYKVDYSQVPAKVRSRFDRKDILEENRVKIYREKLDYGGVQAKVNSWLNKNKTSDESHVNAHTEEVDCTKEQTRRNTIHRRR